MTEAGESLDLLLGTLAALGYCQPDGTFITTLAEPREHLAEMAASGEAACLDGPRTPGAATQVLGQPEGAV